MSEEIIGIIAGAAVIIALTFGGVQCTRISSEKFSECVKVTGKPIECKAGAQ